MKIAGLTNAVRTAPTLEKVTLSANVNLISEARNHCRGVDQCLLQFDFFKSDIQFLASRSRWIRCGDLAVLRVLVRMGACASSCLCIFLILSVFMYSPCRFSYLAAVAMHGVQIVWPSVAMASSLCYVTRKAMVLKGSRGQCAARC